MSVRFEYAGLWIRLVASLVDYCLVLVVFALTLAFIFPQVPGTSWQALGIELVVAALCIIPFWSTLSASPGKLLFGLSIVDARTAKPPTVFQCFIRFIAAFVSALAVMLGIIWIGFDKKKQGWHDKLAQTYVVESGARKKIFVNYRQKVSLMQSGRITDKLASHFGQGNIFHDKSTLVGGANWKTDIEDSIRHCSVLVAIIGDGWLTQVNPDGSRRIDDPDDYVAMEISTALSRGITVIPVLVGEAARLHSDDLPERLKPLALIEPISIRDDDWQHDIKKLINTIYIHTDDPRSVGWRNWSSIPFLIMGGILIGEDVIPQGDALLAIGLSVIALCFNLASLVKFRRIPSPAKHWSIGLAIFALLVIGIAISDSS